MIYKGETLQNLNRANMKWLSNHCVHSGFVPLWQIVTKKYKSLRGLFLSLWQVKLQELIFQFRPITLRNTWNLNMSKFAMYCTITTC